jgi:hypothetical protein
MQGISLAAQIRGGVVPPLAHAQPQPSVEVILLPSDDFERARPRISISNFVVEPGPMIEALMRSAAFKATEHKYDI